MWTKWRLEATKELGQGAHDPFEIKYWIARAA